MDGDRPFKKVFMLTLSFIFHLKNLPPHVEALKMTNKYVVLLNVRAAVPEDVVNGNVKTP